MAEEIKLERDADADAAIESLKLGMITIIAIISMIIWFIILSLSLYI